MRWDLLFGLVVVVEILAVALAQGSLVSPHLHWVVSGFLPCRTSACDWHMLGSGVRFLKATWGWCGGHPSAGEHVKCLRGKSREGKGGAAPFFSHEHEPQRRPGTCARKGCIRRKACEGLAIHGSHERPPPPLFIPFPVMDQNKHKEHVTLVLIAYVPCILETDDCMLMSDKRF